MLEGNVQLFLSESTTIGDNRSEPPFLCEGINRIPLYLTLVEGPGRRVYGQEAREQVTQNDVS